jgi:hypothetical protein
LGPSTTGPPQHLANYQIPASLVLSTAEGVPPTDGDIVVTIAVAEGHDQRQARVFH